METSTAFAATTPLQSTLCLLRAAPAADPGIDADWLDFLSAGDLMADGDLELTGSWQRRPVLLSY